jgi:hypothetical protein
MKHAQNNLEKDFEVNSGKAAPGFDEKGDAIQYQTDMSAGELVEKGFLQEIN